MAAETTDVVPVAAMRRAWVLALVGGALFGAMIGWAIRDMLL